MVGDIEHLRSELDIELFRDALDREILQDREIPVEEMRPVDAIAARVTQQIGASARDTRRPRVDR